MAEHEIPEGYTIGLLATMPRSGTWYSFYFLEFLDIHLSGRETLNTRLGVEIYDSLKLGKISVHATCPGFEEAYVGPLREPWDALDYYSAGYDFGSGTFIENNMDVFAPTRNPGIRIVYLYRNPLDQCVSYYRHAENHVRDEKRKVGSDNGKDRPIESLSDFMRSAGLDSYIKQYLSYRLMSQKYDANILMVPYEKLIRHPHRSYRRMLRFWNVPVDASGMRMAMDKAITSAAPESLRNIEAVLGNTLGRDQESTSNESHLRGGKIGKWREALSTDDIEFAEKRLAAFDLALSDFVCT